MSMRHIKRKISLNCLNSRELIVFVRSYTVHTTQHARRAREVKVKWIRINKKKKLEFLTQHKCDQKLNI